MARGSRIRSPLFAAVLRPFQAFFALEAAGGILLLLAALLALALANSPWAALYQRFVEAPLEVRVGGAAVHFTVRDALNDALMALFFLVVGMEIKRELVAGELRSLRHAALPLAAAVGGMALPALLYLAFTRGTPAAGGWGIPVATDIAFALGCVTLLKGRIPHGLVVFLTAMAIFDDIGGILVIALFYGEGIAMTWLLVAAAITAVTYLGGRLQIYSGLFYAACGVALWYAVHHAGIHPTIAGVVLGLCVPARPLRPAREVLSELHSHTGKLLQDRNVDNIDGAELLSIEERIEELEPPLTRFTHALHPYVAFAIVPLFALTNAGVSLVGIGVSSLASPVTLGIIVGLVMGKAVGIFGASWAAVRVGFAQLPEGARFAQVLGIALLGGIGFTVSLFIAQLAFEDAPQTLTMAKLGVLVGSALAAVLGTGLLRLLPPAGTGAAARVRR